MTHVSKDLELKLKNLPTSPGVYLFTNAKGKIIYIGKAKNLRNRVRSYFRSANTHDPKTERMVSKIADLTLMVTAKAAYSAVGKTVVNVATISEAPGIVDSNPENNRAEAELDGVPPRRIIDEALNEVPYHRKEPHT